MSTRGDFLAALAGKLKGHARDTLDLLDRVAHGVESGFVVAHKSAWFPEVEAAEQFTNEHDVGATNDLFFQRGTVGNAGINDCRTEVGESLERLAQSEQTGFDALFGRKMVVLRRSYCAQQHRVALQTGFDRLGRKRRSELIDGHAADGALGEFELVVTQVRHAAQNAHRFPSDFGTDAVAGQDRNLQLSTGRQLVTSSVVSKSRNTPLKPEEGLNGPPKTEWATQE